MKRHSALDRQFFGCCQKRLQRRLRILDDLAHGRLLGVGEQPKPQVIDFKGLMPSSQLVFPGEWKTTASRATQGEPGAWLVPQRRATENNDICK
jgi:hypothetical protein